MKIHTVLLTVFGIAASAHAQIQTQGSVTYTLSAQIFGQGAGTPWSAPIPNGNGDSNLDPGEGVLFRITVSMSIAPGAATTANGGTLGGPLTWDPAVQANSSGSGTNAGFWDGDLNLVGLGTGAQGTWSDGTTSFALSVRRRLFVATASGNNGIVAAGGASLTDINPGQFGADADALNHSNNFVVFQGLWIPSSFVGSSTWQLTQGSLGLSSSVFAADSNYDTGYTLPVALHVTSIYAGTQQFGIPAPSGLPLIALGGLAAARRRR
jgi:hypothetical protein